MNPERILQAVLSEWPAIVSSIIAFIAVGMAWLNAHFQRKQTRWLETYKARFNYQFKRLERLQVAWESVLDRTSYQLTEEDFVLGVSGKGLPMLEKVVSNSTENIKILFQAYNKCGHLMDEDIRVNMAKHIEYFEPHFKSLLFLNGILKAPIEPEKYLELSEKNSQIEDSIARLEKSVSELVIVQLLRINQELEKGTKLKLA